MRRKYLDKSDWIRISKSKSKLEKINTDGVEVYIYGIYIEKANKKFEIEQNGNEYVILDDGYTWLQILPLNKHYAITVVFDKNKNLIQWYIDITNMNAIDDEKRPFFDDLYLDIIISKDGDITLKDENELSEALNNNDITSEQYKMAYKEARLFMDKIKQNGVDDLIDISKKALEYIKL